MRESRVLLIGIDGLSLDFVKSLNSRGLIPHIGRFLEKGSYGSLKSTLPPLTPPAWTSAFTGVNPGKHGIFGFIRTNLERGEQRAVDSTLRGCKALWNIVSESGKRAIVINVPITYPTERINGIMISGMLTPSPKSDFVYPKQLREKILRYGYRIDPISHNKMKSLAHLAKVSVDVAQRRSNVARQLMKQYNWDLFIIVFVLTDRLQHVFWRYCDPDYRDFYSEKASNLRKILWNCYKKLDAMIGRLIELSGAETRIILFSDHGFGGIRRRFHINNWLMKQGLLSLREKKRQITGTILRRLGVTRAPIVRLTSILQVNAHTLPDRIKIIGRRTIPTKNMSFHDIDLKRTVAVGFQYGSIRINPSINPKYRQKIIDYIMNALNSTTDLDRNPFKNVYKREEVYSGPYVKDAPEIQLEMQDSYNVSSSLRLKGKLFEAIQWNTPDEWSGDHGEDGIFIMCGDGIKEGIEIPKKRIVDIAPTILHLLNLPIPTYMDGEVMLDAFPEEEPFRH